MTTTSKIFLAEKHLQDCKNEIAKANNATEFLTSRSRIAQNKVNKLKKELEKELTK